MNDIDLIIEAMAEMGGLQNQYALGSWTLPNSNTVPAPGVTSVAPHSRLPTKNENEENVSLFDNLSENEIKNILTNINNIFYNKEAPNKTKLIQITNIIRDLLTINNSF